MFKSVGLGSYSLPPSRRALVALFAVTLALQACLFAGSFGAFFGSDGIFYLARKVDAAQVGKVFAQTDDRGHYRPLTLVFFSFVLYPMFGLDRVGYHSVPLLFHAANTILAFFVVRRLVSGSLAVTAAMLYFALHPINFYVSYGITFLPDFTYAFFYLAGLLLLFSYQDSGRRGRLVLALGAFALSLLCKEAAVTFPFVAGLSMLTRGRREAGASLFRWRVTTAIALCACILGVYLAFLVSIKGGALFPRDPRDPYRSSFHLSTMLAKARYVSWGLGLPTGTGTLKGHPRAMSLLERFLPESAAAAAGQLPNVFVRGTWLARLVLMLPLACFAVLGLVLLRSRQPMAWVGLVWFLVCLTPVLFLQAKTMRHNLYVPLVGLSTTIGLSVQEIHSRLGKRKPRLAAGLIALLFCAYVGSGALAVHSYRSSSWPVEASRAAENALDDLRRLRPGLTAGSTLFFLDNRRDDLVWLFEGGNLFRVFHPDRNLRTVFEQAGERLADEELFRPHSVVLAYDADHLYDLTESYRARRRGRAGYDLIDHYEPRSVAFDHSERYPLGGFLNSPNGEPVFSYRFARGGEWRESLVTLAGASVTFPAPELTSDSVLRVGTTMVHDLGDGAEGTIWFVSARGAVPIYSRRLDPAHRAQDRRWFDQEVPLGHLAGLSGKLVLQCRSGASRDTGADWFAWSILRIESR